MRLYLTKTDDTGDEFKRKFVLYVLGAFLCPTTMPALSLSFIHAVKDVKGMGFCNWAKLTLEFLVHGVRKYRNKGHREATGCIFRLVLFYLDCVSPTSVTTPATTRSVPRLNDWGDAEIRETLRRL